MLSNKTFATLGATTALALAGLFSAHAAEAHTNVQWSVSVGVPGAVVYGASAPVVYAPAPVVYSAPPPVVYYNAPRVVYDAPRVVFAPPVVVAPRRHPHPSRWDVDGDGIPNRYDAVYNPRWDRDGDGIPNRYDRHPNHGRSGYGR